MARWVWSGAIVGAILGALGGGVFGALLVGLLGVGIGALVGRSVATSPSPGRAPPPAPHYGARAPDDASVARDARRASSTTQPPTRGASSLSPELLARLDALDARLARIEARLAGGVVIAEGIESLAPVAPASPVPELAAVDVPPAPVVPSMPEPVVASPSADRASVDAPVVPVSQAGDGLPTFELQRASDEPVAAESEKRVSIDEHAGPSAPPPRPDYGVAQQPASTPSAPAAAPALWRWLTGGNAVTRIGIVILFFGVAFLLTYFAEVVTVPIELKLAAAGSGGLLLAGLGVALARKRPAYGLSLQGAGMGIVYLVTFAAFRLYEALAPSPAIALLVLVAATTIALALRHDSQPLAALALAGGFLAPVLIRTDATDPALLFGYFAILNAVILALAMRRAWRPLNVLGFVFTFALSLLWGWRFYTPSHYAIVQPFLALFFIFYVGIALLYARRGPLAIRAPVDAVLVFGVPIVGFALQMAIVRGYRYGVAWSAATLAAFYGALWWLLRRRVETGLALLARAFAVLAIGFATLAIPFAADPRATSAWWAIEAAGVYWIGVVQRRRLARGFALALQIAAALAFLADIAPLAGRPFLNANFLGAALIGLAALATAWTADRHRDALSTNEVALVPAVFVWGAAWWTLGGVAEVLRHVDPPADVDMALAWVAATTALALAGARLADWPRLAWIGAALLPTMGVAALRDIEAVRTTLTHYGWLAWPGAWALQWAVLRRGDELVEAGESAAPGTRVRSDYLGLAHTVSAIALVAWLSWEASEWTGRRTPGETVWIACAAALPPIAFLALVLRARASMRWPFDRHREAYGASAGTTIAALVAVWFVIVNVASPGDPAPLPYLPIANPLDLTLLAALVAVARWARAFGRIEPPTLYGGLGIAAFLALNGTVVRTAHHWGDVPWRLAPLAAYRPLQAALTLTWTVTALALMFWATRRSVRVAWMVGAGLLAVVVVKLFALDLAALSGLTRVVAFMGVGALLLVIGYVAPLPPAAGEPDEAVTKEGQHAV